MPIWESPKEYEVCYVGKYYYIPRFTTLILGNRKKKNNHCRHDRKRTTLNRRVCVHMRESMHVRIR